MKPEKHCILTQICGIYNNVQRNLFTSRNTGPCICREQTYRFQGGGQSGVDWEIGIHIYITTFFFLRVKQSGGLFRSKAKCQLYPIPGDSENEIATTWVNMNRLCTRWHRLVDFKAVHSLEKTSSVVTCGGGWPVRAVCPQARKR